MKTIKTNVIRALQQNHISYQEYCYETKDGLISGLDVAAKLQQNPEQVFKTLVLSDRQTCYISVVPVSKQLNLKKAAKAFGVKSLDMLPQKDLLAKTGYIHGGCSPLGMKRHYPTLFDQQISQWEDIMVSGGKPGIQVCLNRRDLLELTAGKIADLCD